MNIYFLEDADWLRRWLLLNGSRWVIRSRTGLGGGFFIGAILAGEIAEADFEFRSAHHSRVHGALNMAWESDAVPYLVFAHKSNLFQENGGRFNKLADFPDRHPTGGIDPNLTFEKTHRLLPG